MREFKDGALHSGSSTGPVVTKRKQAVAIALSEQDQNHESYAYDWRKHAHPTKNLKHYAHPKKSA
jgi:hypothetical protein